VCEFHADDDCGFDVVAKVVIACIRQRFLFQFSCKFMVFSKNVLLYSVLDLTLFLLQCFRLFMVLVFALCFCLLGVKPCQIVGKESGLCRFFS